MAKREKNEDTKLVWIDLEMTGLNPELDEILELAVIITDVNLENIQSGPELVLQQTESRLEQMDDWNRSHHSRSGLWEKVINSPILLKQAEEEVLNFLSSNMNKNEGVLAGNSIWQDRRFISKYMPAVDSYLHYRMLDVSSIKILANSWYPLTNFHKKGSHRAKDDILESINELKYYRENIFK